MKNIIVVLMLLLVSQILVAGSQNVSPGMNNPNDCGSIEKSILPYFLFSFSSSEENSKCGDILYPEKTKIIKIKEKEDEKKICDFPGACGEPDYNEENFQRIKLN